MWISNTATSAMMLPIAQAVLLEIKATATKQDSAPEERREQAENDQLVAVRYTRRYTNDSSQVDVTLKSADEEESSLVAEATTSDDAVTDTSSKDANSETSQRTSPPSPPTDVQHGGGFNRLTKGLMLGIAYSANIGGTATLTGTGPNLVLSGDVTRCRN